MIHAVSLVGLYYAFSSQWLRQCHWQVRITYTSLIHTDPRNVTKNYLPIYMHTLSIHKHPRSVTGSSLSLFLSLFVCLPLSLSLCLSLCVSVSLSLCLCLCLSVSVSQFTVTRAMILACLYNTYTFILECHWYVCVCGGVGGGGVFARARARIYRFSSHWPLEFNWQACLTYSYIHTPLGHIDPLNVTDLFIIYNSTLSIRKDTCNSIGKCV